jgi:hypothetical protein
MSLKGILKPQSSLSLLLPSCCGLMAFSSPYSCCDIYCLISGSKAMELMEHGPWKPGEKRNLSSSQIYFLRYFVTVTEMELTYPVSLFWGKLNKNVYTHSYNDMQQNIHSSAIRGGPELEITSTVY